MADIFRKTLKKRMDEIESTPPQKDLPVEKKAPSTMSQADFLYGKKKEEDPRKKNTSQRDALLKNRK